MSDSVQRKPADSTSELDLLTPLEEKWLLLEPDLVVQSADHLVNAARHAMAQAVALAGLYFAALKIGAPEPVPEWELRTLVPLVAWGLAYLLAMMASVTKTLRYPVGKQGALEQQLKAMNRSRLRWILASQSCVLLGLALLVLLPLTE